MTRQIIGKCIECFKSDKEKIKHIFCQDRAASGAGDGEVSLHILYNKRAVKLGGNANHNSGRGTQVHSRYSLGRSSQRPSAFSTAGFHAIKLLHIEDKSKDHSTQ